MQIETSTLAGDALNWCVAQCEGYDVVLLTVEDQRNRWLDSLADDESPEKAAAEWDEYFADTARPKICIRGEDDYKRSPYHTEALMIFNQGVPCFQYDRSWAQAGPIIDREHIDIRSTFTTGGYRTEQSVDAVHASINLPNGATVFDPLKVVSEYGPTKLFAAMRCYVKMKMGEVVEVPDELCKV